MSETLTKIAREIKSAEETKMIQAKLDDARREAGIAEWVKWLRELLPALVHDAVLEDRGYVKAPSECEYFFEACRREGVKIQTDRGPHDRALFSIRIEDLKKAAGIA